MSITKYLCKKFDKEDKKYVTVEDITDGISDWTSNLILDAIPYIIVGGLLLAFSVLIFEIVGELYYNIFYGSKLSEHELNFSVINIMTGFFIVIITIFLLILLYRLWEKIKEFKVVKCSLKEE